MINVLTFDEYGAINIPYPDSMNIPFRNRHNMPNYKEYFLQTNAGQPMPGVASVLEKTQMVYCIL